MNKLEPLDIEWKMKTSMSLINKHHTLYRDDRLSIQMEVIVNKCTETGKFGKEKRYYFIDDCEKEMTDVNELCKTWNELKNFDDPDNQIVWVKKIVPTVKIR